MIFRNCRSCDSQRELSRSIRFYHSNPKRIHVKLIYLFEWCMEWPQEPTVFRFCSSRAQTHNRHIQKFKLIFLSFVVACQWRKKRKIHQLFVHNSLVTLFLSHTRAHFLLRTQSTNQRRMARVIFIFTERRREFSYEIARKTHK